MLSFRTPEHERIAALLGFSSASLQRCAEAPALDECQRRFEELKVSIKRAYRRLALDLHPDRNPGDKEKEEQFKGLAQMYPEIEQFLANLRIGPRQPVVQQHRVVIVTNFSGGSTTSSTVTNSYSPWASQTWVTR